MHTNTFKENKRFFFLQKNLTFLKLKLKYDAGTKRLISGMHIVSFIRNYNFPLRLRLLSEDFNFRLKAAKKLLNNDGYYTFFRPCMDNTNDSKKVLHMLYCK